VTVRGAIALLAIAVSVATVHADPAEDAADAAFRATQQRAAAGDAAAIDDYEAIGSGRPITRWTDDAWAEAARLAERAGDFARARRALEQVIAIGTDDQLVRRARGTLARLATMTGDGRWDAVAKEHERLVGEVFGGDDPREELAALAALVAKHPGYPRVNAVRGAIARGWEQEGDADVALSWYRAAAADGTAEPGRRSHLELVRALLRAGELDEAEQEISVLAQGGRPASGSGGASGGGGAGSAVSAPTVVDSAGLAAVREQLATERTRGWIRRGLWAVLALLLAGAVLAVRRDVGSLAVGARRLARPPIEVVFLAPLAVLMIIVAYRGNPLVAHAVRDIAIGGVVVAWISGALLEVVRARHGSVPMQRAMIQGLLVLVAVATLAYLALDRDHLLDLVRETWRGGPAMR